MFSTLRHGRLLLHARLDVERSRRSVWGILDV